MSEKNQELINKAYDKINKRTREKGETFTFFMVVVAIVLIQVVVIVLTGGIDLILR